MIWPKKIKKRLLLLRLTLFNRRKRGNPLSLVLRKVFENQKVKKIQGLGLVIVLTISGLFSSPMPVFGFIYPPEINVQPELLNPVTTETTFRLPVKGQLSQGFHLGHPAVDIAGNNNEDIYPVANGKVIEVSYSRWSYGNKIVIQHEGNLISLYAHLNKINVNLDDQVDKDTVLATVGSSGWATGPHLHLEIWQDYRALNPSAVISGLEK